MARARIPEFESSHRARSAVSVGCKVCARVQLPYSIWSSVFGWVIALVLGSIYNWMTSD
jgi:hypothetical protein